MCLVVLCSGNQTFYNPIVTHLRVNSQPFHGLLRLYMETEETTQSASKNTWFKCCFHSLICWQEISSDFFSWLWNRWFLICFCPLSGTLILWNSRLPSLLCFCLVKRLCHLSDVDECEMSVCAEECLNTLGSFRCFCDGRQGTKLSQDLRSCKVKYTNCGKCSTNHRFHISPLWMWIHVNYDLHVSHTLEVVAFLVSSFFFCLYVCSL